MNNKEKMAEDIEIIMAEVVKLPVKTHVDVLGDKWKFINALAKGLPEFGYTNTGKWSSSKPNLQNITRDEKFGEE